MSASTRLYERLGQIPQDPADPESLEDVIVCAFGAFERYYMCWKTRGGEYRQDGYDLPSDLEEWLFADASIRDFASLQVVFGRGDEFFAADKNGKLEYKEPEKKEPSPEELDEKRALRRSRTMSFIRFQPDVGPKQGLIDIGSPSLSRRSSLISQSAGRPPSLSLSLRSMSETSLFSQPMSRPTSISYSRLGLDASLHSQFPSQPNGDPVDKRPMDTLADSKEHDTSVPISMTNPTRISRRPRPLSMSFSVGIAPQIPEGKQVPLREPTPSLPPIPSLPVAAPAALWPSNSNSVSHFPPSTLELPEPSRVGPKPCTCGCHSVPFSNPNRADRSTSVRPLKFSIIVSSISTTPIQTPDDGPITIPSTSTSTATQTSPLISPNPQTTLHVNTSFATQSTYPSVTEIETPQDYYYSDTGGQNPFFMGRMLDYYSKPGYQLGDSLKESYHMYQEPVYEYRDEFVVLAA